LQSSSFFFTIFETKKIDRLLDSKQNKWRHSSNWSNCYNKSLWNIFFFFFYHRLLHLFNYFTWNLLVTMCFILIFNHFSFTWSTLQSIHYEIKERSCPQRIENESGNGQKYDWRLENQLSSLTQEYLETNFWVQRYGSSYLKLLYGDCAHTLTCTIISSHYN